jgi:ribulose 1,5-bisphosphate synthetase/thiazole synthase
MALQPEAPISITAKSLNGALMTEKSKELIDNISSFLDSTYEITEQPIGTRRPIRVVCLGAGYSGLMMSIMFSQKMQGKNAELVVYERNLDLGGTWLENR